MNIQNIPETLHEKPRLSLEQKIEWMVRRFRGAERCRGKYESKPACRSKFRCLSVTALTIVALAIFAFSFTARAANAVSAFEQANAAFAAGNYPAAIAQYDRILAHDGASAPVLFNLANAHYRAGQFGTAILDYERAQMLAPRDHSIAANLQLAREKVGVSAPALNPLQQMAQSASPNSLAWIGSIAFIVICLVLGVNRFLPGLGKIKFAGGFAALTLLAVVAAFAIRWPEFHRAIVVTANAPARIAPANTAAESFALKAGEPVTIAKNYGRFILARTADGKSGWISDKDLGRVFATQFNAAN